MKTYNERREVARRLREAASYYESMERDVDFYPVESALGLKPTGETAYTPESVRSLADLIEPSGYECVPAKVPQRPQEAGKGDDPPPATRIESVRLRNGETFSWEQPPLL